MTEKETFGKIGQLPKKIIAIIDSTIPFNEIVSIPIDNFLLHFLNIKAIYFIFSDKKIIYIGYSYNLGPRLRCHLSDQRYYEKVTSIKILRLKYDDWFDGAGIEAYLINKYNPKYNKTNAYLNSTSIPLDFNINKIVFQLDET